MSVTKLAYRVWHHPDEGHREEIPQFKGKVSMADYRFRINAERLGIDPRASGLRSIGPANLRVSFGLKRQLRKMRFRWLGEKAVELIGLRTE